MSRASIIRFVALACIWGSSFLLIKLALAGLSPVQIAYARLAAGAVVLLTVLAVRRQRLPGDRVLWGHLALMSFVANIIPFSLFGFGEERITSGLAGVLNGTTPLFTLGFAVGFLPEERLSAMRAAGFVLGFVGVVLVIGPWDQNPLTSSIPGQLACLGAAMCYGAAFVYTRRFITPRGVHPTVLAAGQLTAAVGVLTLGFPVVAASPVHLDPVVAGSALALGAFGTGIAYLLYYRLIVDAGATTTSMVTYLIPVVAVILGVLVLSEPVTWNVFAGAVVVILGVMVAEGRVRRRLPETVDAPPPDPVG